MKRLENYEIERLAYVLKLVKGEIQKNNTMYSKLLQNTEDEELIYNMSKNYSSKLKNLEKSLVTPYFARVDFKADDEKRLNKIYIGKTNIFNEDSEIEVVDWRAPISSIYYDGQMGRTEYTCPEGIIKGNLSLKRQYSIQDGELLDYNDIDITTTDQLLQNCLNENSDSRLKNIVATIQSEQNKIIRANMFKPLIVQGVAGSGKTTVALHRIAYLVYTYEKNFNPEDFLIIAPNRFFLDYISNVLPDLGVDYVRQQTFENFALEIIGIKLEVENPNNTLSEIVNKENDKTNLLQATAKFKSSMNFKNIIDEWLNDYYNSILPKCDFKVLEHKVIDYNDIKDILNQSLINNSLKSSIEILGNIIQKKVSNLSNELIQKITATRSKKLEQIDKNADINIQQKIRNEIFAESEFEIAELMKGGKKLVVDYLKKIKIDRVQDIYKKIVNDKTRLRGYIEEELFEYISERLNANLKKKKIEYEDLSAILYIHYKINGLNEKLSLQHIVIDEAQDFGEFQFYTLNKVLNKNKSITILGDIAQGIYSYRGTENWDRINEIVFDGQASINRLDNSYRTTTEIMNEANNVLAKIKQKYKINLAIPVSRHGEKVEYIRTKTNEEKIKILEEKIIKAKNKGYKNIAVIAKDMKICQNIYQEIDKQKIEIELLSENMERYDGGITIIPSYLSKGLEFDSVIILGYDSFEDSDLDIKLLYISMTRAMHTLDIIY